MREIRQEKGRKRSGQEKSYQDIFKYTFRLLYMEVYVREMSLMKTPKDAVMELDSRGIDKEKKGAGRGRQRREVRY